MRKRLKVTTAFAFSLISGCSALPRSGPSASAMIQSPDVAVVNVTPDLADALAKQNQIDQQSDLARALNCLKLTEHNNDVTFAPGDRLAIVLWSFSSWSGAPSTDLLQPDGPGPTALGSFTISAEGTVTLPYVGSVNLAGLSLVQAQDQIAALYQSRKFVERPTITIDPISLPQGSILVTGSIGEPKVIPWTPAGITLASAITDTLGNGAETLSQSSDVTDSKSAIQVEILRDGRPPVQLPMDAALEQPIDLQPSDRVIIRRAPAVKVSMLGDGIRKNGIFGYAEPPVLSDVLADASGLDSYVADDRSIFVLRHQPDRKPVLYDFAWNDVEGVVSAQDFPMADGDLVYVAEAPIVPVEKVISMLFQLAVPAELAK